MIVVKLTGGLGNQMFQYALGRHLAHKNQVKLKLDISSYKQNQPREYSLYCLNIREDILTGNRLSFLNLRQKLKVFLSKRIEFFYQFDKEIFLEKRKFQFDKEVLKQKGNVYLYGYWQNPRYFQAIENIIRQDFQFAGQLDRQNSLLANKIRNTNSVSIHIRRGDYADNPKARAFHGLLDLNYYHKAIKHIVARINRPHFFVFSDDLQWAKKNLNIKYKTEYIQNNKESDSYKDMQLMSFCHHNIIANSSFSWWGAWLNIYKDKLVIAPGRWSNDQHASEIIPDSWIKIS